MSLTDLLASVKMGLEVAKSLPAGSGEDWLCWQATAHRGWPCEDSDEEMGISRRGSVGGLRLRGAIDDGPPPLLPSTRRDLYLRATAEDLSTVTERAKACAPASGKKLCEGHERRRATPIKLMSAVVARW